ncbi:MAG TPA: anti-sigma factor [Gemmatimonadaceae bacterium]|nr:anti-sigma factor [Gemmatimonadaceae bacterium]
MRCDECRDLLGADADGELMPEESNAIREHLASCSQCTAEHDAMRELSRRLKDGLDRPRAPDVLKARIRSSLARPTLPGASAPAPRAWRTSVLAAGVMIAALSATASYAVARRGTFEPSVGEQVLSSHIRSLMPGHLTDVASNDLHNVKPWFNGRVDLSPNVPRLDSLGYPLVGGRLDYVSGRSVAAVVYTRRQHVINVFSWPIDRGDASAASMSTEHGYHLAHWRAGGAEYWVASDVSEPDLRRFVELFERAGGTTDPK